MAGDARVVLNVGVVEFQSARAGVLWRRGIFVHKTLAEFIDGDPNHFSIFISRSGPDMTDGEGQFGKFEPVAAVEMPHMPQAGAGLLRHLDAVAGVAEIDGINRARFEVL